MIRGFVEHVNDPGGAVGYLGNLAPWDHVFKDTLYATQEILGDAVAVRLILLYLNLRIQTYAYCSDIPMLGHMGSQLAYRLPSMHAVHRQLEYVPLSLCISQLEAQPNHI